MSLINRFPTSDEYLRRLIEEAQDIIYRCDAHGCFVYVNPTAIRLMQYDEDELLGRNYLTLVRPDYRKATEQHYRRQFTERTPNTYFEFPAVARDGHTIWIGQHVQLVFEGDKLIAVQAIARDITRQREAEASLRLSEARYRSLVHGASYPIYRTDADGRFIEVNQAFLRLTGYDSAEEVLDTRAAELYEDQSARMQLVERGRSEGRVEGFEVRWKRRDRRVITVRLSGRAVVDDDGSFHGFEIIAEDVTERRRLEDHVRQSQKLEAVSQLAAGVAHHFNNLMMAVLGYTELLLARRSSNAEDREDLEEIRKAGKRAATLTRQLLAFSRRQVAPQVEFDVSHQIGELETELRLLLPPVIKLTIHPSTVPTLVEMDPHDLRQIVRQLVLNARDAMPDGGEIRIEIERHDRYAQIRVVDNGSGMSPETRAHLFEPFFSTKPQDEGTGLGLASVYGIVHQRHGAINVDSELGAGTTIVVRLPLANIAHHEGQLSRAASD